MKKQDQRREAHPVQKVRNKTKKTLIKNEPPNIGLKHLHTKNYKPKHTPGRKEKTRSIPQVNTIRNHQKGTEFATKLPTNDNDLHHLQSDDYAPKDTRRQGKYGTLFTSRPRDDKGAGLGVATGR